LVSAAPCIDRAVPHRANEIGFRPASDPGCGVRCEIWTVEGAERRLERAAAGEWGRFLLVLGVTGETSACLREVEAAACVSRGARARGSEEQRKDERARRPREVPRAGRRYCARICYWAFARKVSWQLPQLLLTSMIAVLTLASLPDFVAATSLLTSAWRLSTAALNFAGSE